MRILIFIISVSLIITTEINAMSGPGEGGGDCFQFNTRGKIIECQNCIVVDGEALGTMSNDSLLVVEAIGCGPISITLEYEFNWNQGDSLNWIHGIAYDAGPLWTYYEEIVPSNWLFQPDSLSGVCSGQSYSQGYYYDGSETTSAPSQISLSFILGMGMMCESTYENIGLSPCEAICSGNEELFLQISGDCQEDGDLLSDLFTSLNAGTGWPNLTGANDGDPSNNWGVDCGVTPNGDSGPCPVFRIVLSYCPEEQDSTDFLESLWITTTSDGESGAWCKDDNCDYSNGFFINILNACSPNSTFSKIPNNYCNAEAINLNISSFGLDSLNSGWEGSNISNANGLSPIFEYCNNINNEFLSHTVGRYQCYGESQSDSFVVWTPQIQNVNTNIDTGFLEVDPLLSAEIFIEQTNDIWEGDGELIWLEDGNVVTNFLVEALGTDTITRTFTPVFQTGCANCDVDGVPITITALPMTSGIHEGKNSEMSIYPNPVKDILKISSNKINITKIQILDLYGKVIYLEMLGRQHKELINLDVDRIGLSDGVYLIIVEHDQSEVLHQKIVVH